MATSNAVSRHHAYRSFETSIDIIKKTRSKIKDPQIKDVASEDDALKFIETPFVRDKRVLLDGNQLKLLLVWLENRSYVVSQTKILEAAESAEWVHKGFLSFIESGSMGSAVLRQNQNLSFMLQSPSDDLPFVALSMSELHNKQQKNGLDWVCLLFATSAISLDVFVEEESFPSDYEGLSPDYMFLPVRILRWQVEQVRDELTKLMERVLDGEKGVAEGDINTLKGTKTRLFEIGKAHLRLRNRWLFAKDLAANLTKCFDEIAITGNVHSSKPSYSKTLRDRVQTQISMSEMLKHDLETIPSKVKAQHQMVDAELNIMIARYSYVAADQARRDGSSMKTIATLTLFFLPATAVASIFSMSMFDWEAKDGDSVVSTRIWVYFVIAVLLTLLVLGIWFAWYKWHQKKESERTTTDIEIAMSPQLK